MSKERKLQQYFIVLQGKKVEVSREKYLEHYRPIWRTQDKMQRNGECICTKANLWKCEGMCQDCPYYSPKADSIENRLENAGKDIEDVSMSEDTMLDAILFKQLLKELEEMDPDGKRIIDAFRNSETDSRRAVARDLGMPESTLRGKLTKWRETLEKKHGKFFE
jgi:DNA-binding NtrC family response regulator